MIVCFGNLMEITFLGTGSMIPTKTRNVQGIHLQYLGEGILFDCGEGSQRQMAIADISRQKIRTILISHWHGDHVSGLPGLLQTIGNSYNGESPKIKLYGPKGSKKFVEHMLKGFILEVEINLDIVEVDSNKPLNIDSTDSYDIFAVNLNHSVPSLGFSFVEKDFYKLDKKKSLSLGLKEGPLIGELKLGKTITVNGVSISPKDVLTVKKGKKLSVILDTYISQNAIDLAMNSDILICESTFSESLSDKAKEALHLTSKMAAEIARDSNSKELILTHFSQRYKDPSVLESEAKKVFSKTKSAVDLMKVKL